MDPVRPPASRGRVAVGALALALLLSACHEDTPSPARTWPVRFEPGAGTPRFDRVILVTIDTLRADHVSAYGYFRKTTPFLDRLAERGVLFERAMAAVSHTAPSHATMLTGLTPFEHGVEQNGQSLAPSASDLASLFRGLGYETAAFLNVKFLRGITPSFDEVTAETNSGPLVDAAMKWLRQGRREERFFLWLHLYGPHRWKDTEHVPERSLAALKRDSPLEGPELFERERALHGLPAAGDDGSLALRWAAASESGDRIEVESVRDWLEIIDRYDAHIRHADELVERLHAAVEGLNLPGTTLWIVTSDHGEGLASHGVAGHGSRIYQEQLHVPFLLAASDHSIGPARIRELVAHVDLLPTLAQWMGVRVEGLDPDLHGVSLVPLLEGSREWTPREVFSQRRPVPEDAEHRGKRADEELYALQDGRSKLLLHEPGAEELYDLEADPLESENLAESDPDARIELERRLRARVTVYKARRRGGAPEVPEEWAAELRDLGYVE